MHGYVVDQKLPYLYSHIYMCSNACMLAAKVACVWLICSKNERFNLHDVQLAFHKKKETRKGIP